MLSKKNGRAVFRNAITKSIWVRFDRLQLMVIVRGDKTNINENFSSAPLSLLQL
jgi:hypothetical protein